MHCNCNLYFPINYHSECRSSFDVRESHLLLNWLDSPLKASFLLWLITWHIKILILKYLEIFWNVYLSGPRGLPWSRTSVCISCVRTSTCWLTRTPTVPGRPVTSCSRSTWRAARSPRLSTSPPISLRSSWRFHPRREWRKCSWSSTL